jgi:two-component system cell cycle sensor histidine kinase/response regulator CckA
MEAVGRLAGGIAHDFNNLLTIISGFSELLLLELKTEDPNRSSVNAIRDAAQRAASLTRQLLVFSRKQIVEPVQFDLNEVVVNSEKLLRRLIGEDIILTSVLPDNLRSIEADPNQVEQIIMNLVVNARDAMPSGGRITIETKNVDIAEEQMYGYLDLKLGRYVQLAVSDTGHGMTEEIKSQIFEPFFTTKEAGKGTGLGLAVVHGIVKHMGGYIHVYSELNMGTSFKILLPAITSSIKRSPAVTLQSLRQGTETILLVEDEPAVRQIARISLETQGYKVLEVSRGLEAIDLIHEKTEQIDLLLTDVVMPEMGGKELVELIRPYHPKLKVLFMSGYTDDAIVRHGIIEGTDAFIQKPFSPLGLAKKVRAVLDGPPGE